MRSTLRFSNQVEVSSLLLIIYSFVDLFINPVLLRGWGLQSFWETTFKVTQGKH